MAEYENNTIVETTPTEPDYNEPGRNWLKLIGMVLAAIIVAVLLVLGARWVYNAITDSGTERTGSGQPADETKLPQEPGATSSTSSTNANTGSSTTQTPRNNQTNTSLPNSGPEHVAAVFAGSSLAGAGLHYIINRRRNP